MTRSSVDIFTVMLGELPKNLFVKLRLKNYKTIDTSNFGHLIQYESDIIGARSCVITRSSVDIVNLILGHLSEMTRVR